MPNRPYVVLYAADHPDIGRPSAQLTRLRTWAQWLGATVVAEITDAPGDMIRPGLLQALELVRTDEADTVAVADMRAIHPTEAGQLAYVAEVGWYNGTVHALAEPVETDTRSVLATYEQMRQRWHRAETASRLHRGKRAAAEDPEHYRGGRIPLGLKTIGGRLVEESEDMGVVARVRELRRAGRGYSEIARVLSAEQYKTKEGKTTWHAEQVKRVVVRHGDDDQPSGAPDVREPCR